MPHWLNRDKQETVPLSDLSAIVGTSGSIDDARQTTEDARLAIQIAGAHLWNSDPVMQGLYVSAWLAEVCVSVADKAIEAGTVREGQVDAAVAALVRALYAEASEWAVRAVAAHANPAYRLDVTIPAPFMTLPVPPTPLRAYGRALAAGATAIRSLAQGALADTQTDNLKALPPVFEGIVPLANQKLAEAAVLADRLKGLAAQTDMSPEIFFEIVRLAQDLYERYWWLIQALAKPGLFGKRFIALNPINVSDPEANKPKFDPVAGGKKLPPDIGILTDPIAGDAVQADPARMEELRAFWTRDPDPDATLAMQQMLNRAQLRGFIAMMPGSANRRCPWQPTYLVRKPVAFGDTQFAVGDHLQLMVQGGSRSVTKVPDPSDNAIFNPNFAPPQPTPAASTPKSPAFDPATPVQTGSSAAAHPAAPAFDPTAGPSAATTTHVQEAPSFDPGAVSHPVEAHRFDPEGASHPAPPALAARDTNKFDPAGCDPPPSEKFDPLA